MLCYKCNIQWLSLYSNYCHACTQIAYLIIITLALLFIITNFMGTLKVVMSLLSNCCHSFTLWHTPKHQSLILFILSAFAKQNRNTALYDRQTNFLINLKLYGPVLVYIYLLHHFHISNSLSLVRQNGSWLILNFCSVSS